MRTLSGYGRCRVASSSGEVCLPESASRRLTVRNISVVQKTIALFDSSFARAICYGARIGETPATEVAARGARTAMPGYAVPCAQKRNPFEKSVTSRGGVDCGSAHFDRCQRKITAVPEGVRVTWHCRSLRMPVGITRSELLAGPPSARAAWKRRWEMSWLTLSALYGVGPLEVVESRYLGSILACRSVVATVAICHLSGAASRRRP